MKKKKEGTKELLKNNLISFILIIGLISLGAVLAGNVIVKEGNLDVSGAMNATNIYDTALTQGRIPFTTDGGKLIDSSNLTFNAENELYISGGVGIGGNNEAGNLLTLTKNTGSAAAKFQSNNYDSYFLMAGPNTRNQYFAFGNYNTPGSPIFQVGLTGSQTRWSVGSNNFGTEYLTVINGSGKVGIGTTNPEALFDVDNQFRVNNDGQAFWGSTGSNKYGYLSWDTNLAVMGGYTDSDLALYANGEKVRIKTDGNVGIGTTNPSAKLDVAGNVSISQLLKLSPMTLPQCDSSLDGSLGRNSTGIYYCNSTIWRQISFVN